MFQTRKAPLRTPQHARPAGLGCQPRVVDIGEFGGIEACLACLSVLVGGAETVVGEHRPPSTTEPSTKTTSGQPGMLISWTSQPDAARRRHPFDAATVPSARPRVGWRRSAMPDIEMSLGGRGATSVKAEAAQAGPRTTRAGRIAPFGPRALR